MTDPPSEFRMGDWVKITEEGGAFFAFEGEISSIDELTGRVTVEVNVFGRPTPVELDVWSIERAD